MINSAGTSVSVAFTSHRTVKKGGVTLLEMGVSSQKIGVASHQLSDNKETIVQTVIDNKSDSKVDSSNRKDHQPADKHINHFNGDGFGISLLIGALLVIPVVLIVVVTILIRLYKAGTYE